MSDCKASIDGWCETHSTGDGPSWCVDSLKLALRRARFHERENYQRIKDERARGERYRLAWVSARRRAAQPPVRAATATPTQPATDEEPAT